MPLMRNQILPELADRYFRQGGDGGFRLALIQGGNQNGVLYSSDPDQTPVIRSSADAVMNIFGPPPQSMEGNLWEAVKRTNSVQPGEWRNIVGPVWFPVIRYSATDEPWVLAIRHRSGRLDDIVLRVRRDNLLISSVVLLLLATNISLIVYSAYRVRKLAQLQIDFVASVSHELRTPLAALLSAGENIHDGVVEGQEKLARYGSVIASQARQLIGLVDQILLFASTGSGNRSYYLKPLRVSDLIEAAYKRTSTVAQAGFTVERSIVANLPSILADQEATLQCIQNLLTNAVKYSGKSRWIGISAQTAQLNGKEGVSISVADHGIGINEADLTQIFEPFFRSPSVRAAQIRGTGLGLSVTKRIVEDMGGELVVRSELKAGSLFAIILPVAPFDEIMYDSPDGNTEVTV
jgi:signal transduction histidine kinase